MEGGMYGDSLLGFCLFDACIIRIQTVNIHELTNSKLSALKVQNSLSIDLCNHKFIHLSQLQVSIFTAFVSYL